MRYLSTHPTTPHDQVISVPLASVPRHPIFGYAGKINIQVLVMVSAFAPVNSSPMPISKIALFTPRLYLPTTVEYIHLVVVPYPNAVDQIA